MQICSPRPLEVGSHISLPMAGTFIICCDFEGFGGRDTDHGSGFGDLTTCVDVDVAHTCGGLPVAIRPTHLLMCCY